MLLLETIDNYTTLFLPYVGEQKEVKELPGLKLTSLKLCITFYSIINPKRDLEQRDIKKCGQD